MSCLRPSRRQGAAIAARLRGAVIVMAICAAFPADAATRRSAKKKTVARDVPVTTAASADLGPGALGKLRMLLSGTDDEVILETVRVLGTSRAPNAVVPLVEVLAVGTTPTLAVATLQAIQKLASPRAADVVIVYCGHRNPEVRRAAIEALTALPDPRAAGVLLARLGDEDEGVRAVAVEAATKRVKSDATPRLLAMLTMRESVAAAPLGRVAPLSLIPTFLELRGRVRDADLAILFGEVLKRGDLTDSTRVDIVRALADIPGPDATTALVEFAAASPAGSGSKPSRTLARKLLDERGKNP